MCELLLWLRRPDLNQRPVAVPEIFFHCREKIPTAATPFSSLHLALRALGNVPFGLWTDTLNSVLKSKALTGQALTTENRQAKITVQPRSDTVRPNFTSTLKTGVTCRKDEFLLAEQTKPHDCDRWQCASEKRFFISEFLYFCMEYDMHPKS